MNYERLYEYRFRDIDQDSRTAVWGEIAPFISKVLGDPEVVLDPAAGRGEFINAVPARERWAVDMVAYPEGTHAPGTEVIVSDIFDAELPQHYFEVTHVQTPCSGDQRIRTRPPLTHLPCISGRVSLGCAQPAS